MATEKALELALTPAGAHASSSSHSAFDIHVPDAWQLYRFGDVIRFQDVITSGYKRREGLERKLLTDQLAHFPGSLAGRYIKEAKASFSWEVLVRLLSNHSRSDAGAAGHRRELFEAAVNGSAVVVHCRLGDVFGSRGNNAIGIKAFNYAPAEYGPVARGLVARGHRAVIIAGGAHDDGSHISRLPETEARNRDFLLGLRRVFREHGLRVHYLLGSEPDDDQLLLHRARFVVPPKWSGFSFAAIGARTYQRPGLVQYFDEAA